MKSTILRVAKRWAIPVAVAGTGVAAFLAWDDQNSNTRFNPPHKAVIPPPTAFPKTRREMIEAASKEEEYDMLIIGGGATGAGVALDAVTRGLKVALVERDDFAAATSSKSTKLVHGGVRYLEKAFWQADYGQYLLVKEALAERKRFLDLAPHLSFPLPIMIPIYKWWQLPYYWVGVKAYDALAGSANLESSYMLTRGRALQAFPMLNDSKLKGAIVYYDGSHNDSRTCASLAITAIEHGADVINHMEVTSLTKNAEGKLSGATAQDVLNPESAPITIKAKCIVNATGPFTDSIRKMDDQKAHDIAIGSSGVHIVLPGYFSPKNMGLLDAATSDGRVVFFLPWQGSTVAGTTDAPCDIEAHPTPKEDEIQFILNEVRHYIDGKVEIDRNDVRAAWSGIRPLVRDPNKADTQNVVRNHAVGVSESGLVTIAGGKWTTFREMAEETVNTCVDKFALKAGPCRTADGSIQVIGGKDWTQLMHVDLIKEYQLEPEVAKHLSENYGTRAFDVARFCTPTNVDASGKTVHRGVRVSPNYPFVDGEILYCMRYEYAQTAIDVLARRTRLAFLDFQAAKEALPKVVDTMGIELGWTEERKLKEMQDGINYLVSMGLHIETQPEPTAAPLAATANPIVPDVEIPVSTGDLDIQMAEQ